MKKTAHAAVFFVVLKNFDVPFNGVNVRYEYLCFRQDLD